MKIVFLTGAGVSAESGVRTFRDHNGMWEEHKIEDVATIQAWRRGPESKELMLRFYNERRQQMSSVEPNLAHKLIGALEKEHDVSIITQNVDNLHERGGSTNVIHLHGELTKKCSSLNKEGTISDWTEDIKLGDKHEDGSQLRPYIVWFGEDVPNLTKAAREVMFADVLVVVGTTLEVYPAASLVDYASPICRKFYIDPTPNTDGVSEGFMLIKEVATEGMKKVLFDVTGETDWEWYLDSNNGK